MPLKLCVTLILLVAALILLWLFIPWHAVLAWAVAEQRMFQNTMARALRGIQAGEPMAIWALCAATAAYGFVHALGPGHGKILIGGAALASGATLRRLAALTVISSLAQAGTAIVAVGGLVFLLRLGSADLMDLTEAWLAPASYAAIAAIGLVLIVRGARSWAQSHRRAHEETECGCGHAHGPGVDDVRTLTSTRDAAALIFSIAIRPCTGALFVLVIAARFDAFMVGALAVVAMGMGTAAFNLLVAGSGAAARQLAGLGAGEGGSVQALSAALHIIGGVLILALSVGMLLTYFP